MKTSSSPSPSARCSSQASRPPAMRRKSRPTARSTPATRASTRSTAASARQDSRIANGDRSGQLTNRETANALDFAAKTTWQNEPRPSIPGRARSTAYLTKTPNERRLQPPPEPSQPHDPPRQAQRPRPGLLTATLRAFHSRPRLCSTASPEFDAGEAVCVLTQPAEIALHFQQAVLTSTADAWSVTRRPLNGVITALSNIASPLVGARLKPHVSKFWWPL